MKTSTARAIGFVLGAAAVILVGSQRTEAASTSGHLYVVLGTAEEHVLQRYPLDAHGLPASQPDLTIPRVGVGIALAADGTLAARSGPNSDVIHFFAPGQMKPNRTLILRKVRGCQIVPLSLAFDPQNYLYVGYRYFGSYCPPGSFRVYAPSASGPAKPLFDIASSNLETPTVAVHPATGELYVFPGQTISVYSQPHTQPVVVRTITDLSGNAAGMAIAPTASPQLFVYNAPQAGGWPSSILEMDANWNGPNLYAEGLFGLTLDIARSGRVAFWNNLVYATFRGIGTAGVNVFIPRAGLQRPLATLAAPAGTYFRDMTAGP